MGVERTGRQFRHRLWQSLKFKENELNASIINKSISDNWEVPIEIDHNDVEFIFHYWKCRCAFSLYITHQNPCQVEVKLIRWEKSKSACISNLLPLCLSCYKQVTDDKEMLHSNIIDNIQPKLQFLETKLL